MKYRSYICNVFFVLFVLCAVNTVLADNQDSPKQKAEFNRFILERNKLHQELNNLDRKAAEALINDKDPIQIYSQQATTQDKLDVIKLKVDTYAIRYGFAIPAFPNYDNNEDSASNTLGNGANNAYERAFDRGRRRAKDELIAQTLRLLASLDFTQFLQNVGKE